MDEVIKLSHGEGGAETQRLIKEVFYHHFNNPITNNLSDSYVFETTQSKLSFTTDSFVVKPLFFRGGNIGKLAVCGTVNDLVTAGAIPICLSAGFIIEEGFAIEKLHQIARTMGNMCKEIGITIVTGDTKVVETGSADGVFINTSGIGRVSGFYEPRKVVPDDEVIITGCIAEHGTAILLDRYDLAMTADLESDCMPLQYLITGLGENLKYVKLMKDPTRGGIATILNEIALEQGLDIEVNENSIPIKDEVAGICELLGIDPLYLACEGRMLLVVEKGFGEKVLRKLRKLKQSKEAKQIGHFTSGKYGLVYMKTLIGGARVIPTLSGQMLPRIC